MAQIISLAIIVMLSSYISLISQAPIGAIRTIKVNSNKDTLILDRKYGDLWIGGLSGFQLSNYEGTLNLLKWSSPEEINNPFNEMLHYTAGTGSGYFFGGIVEYNPKGSTWGFRLQANMFDKRAFTAQTAPSSDDLKTNYQIQSEFRQFSFSPGAKYNLPIEGLHLYGGMNIDIVSNTKSKQSLRFINSGSIREEYTTVFNESNFGYGVHIGIGFDLMIADISSKYRAFVTPFAEVQFRSSMINDNSSSWNSFLTRFGFQMKISQDEIESDTLFYDPSYIPPANYIAQISFKDNVEVAINTVFDDIAAADIEYFPLEKKTIEIVGGEILAKGTDSLALIAAELPDKSKRSENTLTPSKEKKAIELKKNILKKFSYARPTTTELSQDMKDYLAEVAVYLKANPGTRVRVTGHSDGSASLPENTRRARERVTKVENYLLSLKIPRGSLIAEQKGSLDPIATNDTPEGRLLNRRIEITIE